MSLNLLRAGQLYAVASSGGYEPAWTSLVLQLNAFDSAFREIPQVIEVEPSDDDEAFDEEHQFLLDNKWDREGEEKEVQKEGSDNVKIEEEKKKEIIMRRIRERRNKKKKKKEFVWGEFVVPRLYDICSIKWHQMCMRMTREERERAQEVLPKEIPERIRREIRDFCRHDCMGLFYGSGRVRRRFLYTSRAALSTTQRKTKSKNEEKIADAEEQESGRREEGESEVGESFDFEHNDLVLDFCSIACSEKLSLGLWRTSARYQEEQDTIKLS